MHPSHYDQIQLSPYPLLLLHPTPLCLGLLLDGSFCAGLDPVAQEVDIRWDMTGASFFDGACLRAVLIEDCVERDKTRLRWGFDPDSMQYFDIRAAKLGSWWGDQNPRAFRKAEGKIWQRNAIKKSDEGPGRARADFVIVEYRIICRERKEI